MDKINKSTVIVEGREYPIDSPEIIKDFKGNYILFLKRIQIFRNIWLCRNEGLVETNDNPELYASSDQIDQLIQDRELLHLKYRNKHMCYIDVNFINSGNGTIHKHPNNNLLYLDDFTFKKLSNPNKFRPFNNIVKAFDINNVEISDEDKKLIIKRDLDYGVRSLTYKMFEGHKYTYGRRKIS